jgi:FO synthase
MTVSPDTILARAASGAPITDEQVLALAERTDLAALLAAARARRDVGHPALVSYSPKVFIPLTQLCRDVCRYCTFAQAPRALKAPYLSVDEAIAIAEAGAHAGCHEALFTLGDQPERRYAVARAALATLGHDTTIDYLVHVADRVREATGLLPHVNPGLMTRRDLERLRAVSVSAGLMLESASKRLCERGACARCTRATGICRRSSSRTFGRSRVRPWLPRPSRRSTSISGPSRSRASSSTRI